MQNSRIALICADLRTLAYTLKTVLAQGLSNGVEIFLFDGFEVKCDKTRALFSIVCRDSCPEMFQNALT